MQAQYKEPFACGSSCNSWLLGARWKRGGLAADRCQSEVSPLRQPETARRRWTWRRFRTAGKKHSLAAIDGEMDANRTLERRSIDNAGVRCKFKLRPLAVGTDREGSDCEACRAGARAHKLDESNQMVQRLGKHIVTDYTRLHNATQNRWGRVMAISGYLAQRNPLGPLGRVEEKRHVLHN